MEKEKYQNDLQENFLDQKEDGAYTMNLQMLTNDLTAFEVSNKYITSHWSCCLPLIQHKNVMSATLYNCTKHKW